MNLLRMFGKILYGQALYGSNQKSRSGNVQVGQIWFWDYDFSDILISEIPNSYEGNEFDLQTYQLTTHGQGLSNWLIKAKKFTVKGRIQAQDQENLEKKINFIKAKLLSGEKNLYFRQKGWLLKTKAAVSELSIPRKSRTINTAEIQITFFIPIPFWVATNGVEYETIIGGIFRIGTYIFFLIYNFFFSSIFTQNNSIMARYSLIGSSYINRLNSIRNLVSRSKNSGNSIILRHSWNTKKWIWEKK